MRTALLAVALIAPSFAVASPCFPLSQFNKAMGGQAAFAGQVDGKTKIEIILPQDGGHWAEFVIVQPGGNSPGIACYVTGGRTGQERFPGQAM